MKKRKNRVRISQCMIVKNEEKNIEQALSWGKDIMWEQIVVDTGSTDRTVELAQKLGAKVFFFDWINDFAAAKNFAIGKAKGDWIAFLDADEYLTPEGARDIEDLLDRLLESDFDAVSASVKNLDERGDITSSGTQTRFFRNIPDIRYQRRIHEQLLSQSGRELHIGDVSQELAIYHTGYQGEAFAEKKRSKRNYNIILEELKDNPKDNQMLGYMGDEYYSDGDYEEAEKWYRKAIDQLPDVLWDGDQRSALTFSRILMILADREGDCWEYIDPVYQRAIHALPKEADFDYIAGRFFASRGKAGKAVEYLEKAISKLNTYGCYNRAYLLSANLLEAYDLLARCCYEADEPQKCLTYAVNYLKCDKYGMAPLSRLLKVLLQSDCRFGGQDNPAELQAVLEFLAKLYDFSVLKDRLFVIKAAEKSGCQNFAHYAAGCFFSEEERKTLGL